MFMMMMMMMIATYLICDYFQAYHEKGNLTVVVSVNRVPYRNG
jgi:hypothetical protein